MAKANNPRASFWSPAPRAWVQKQLLRPPRALLRGRLDGHGPRQPTNSTLATFPAGAGLPSDGGWCLRPSGPSAPGLCTQLRVTAVEQRLTVARAALVCWEASGEKSQTAHDPQLSGIKTHTHMHTSSHVRSHTHPHMHTRTHAHAARAPVLTAPRTRPGGQGSGWSQTGLRWTRPPLLGELLSLPRLDDFSAKGNLQIPAHRRLKRPLNRIIRKVNERKVV